MDIGGLRSMGYTHRTYPPFPRQPVAQHHDQRQRQAVRAQLYGVPTSRRAPQLPAVGIAAQATNRRTVGQANMTRQGPQGMGQARQYTQYGNPERYGQQVQRTECQHLGKEIRRQQPPAGLPAAFKAITWAGHDPGSSGPCVAAPDLPIRHVP